MVRNDNRGDQLTARPKLRLKAVPRSPAGAAMTPLQAELREDGIDPDPDLLSEALSRADMAPGAGYREDGPEPLGGPEFDRQTNSLRVFQWEIEPQDAGAESGTANIEFGGWEFHIWWQLHPTRLVYASIQAMREEGASPVAAARPHPVGRSEAVNLVYDLDRQGVSAIYGTVKDFRPFVEAFHLGFQTSQNSNRRTPDEAPAGTSEETR